MATPVAKPDLTQHETRHLYKAIESGYLTHRGEYEGKFERLFSKTVSRPAMATSSGTGALHIALLSLGIGRGDEVIVPDFTFGATASVVANVGAKPILVDGVPMDWNKVKQAITRRTKAIIPVHIYGERCHFEDVGIPIIEDSCEALGYVEPTGTMAAYSFYGNKVITSGEGGMLVGYNERSKGFRDGGFTEDYDMHCFGLNYRMTNMQAAVGFAQLERLQEILNARNAGVSVYKDMLDGMGKWMFVAKTRNPESLAAHLKQRGIESRPVFKPLHLTKAFEFHGSFPESVKFWKTGLCLPTGTHVTKEHAHFIAKQVLEHERFSQAA
jgi:perosamine synthetase